MSRGVLFELQPAILQHQVCALCPYYQNVKIIGKIISSCNGYSRSLKFLQRIFPIFEVTLLVQQLGYKSSSLSINIYLYYQIEKGDHLIKLNEGKVTDILLVFLHSHSLLYLEQTAYFDRNTKNHLFLALGMHALVPIL